MKALLAFCLLLFSTFSAVTAQQNKSPATLTAKQVIEAEQRLSNLGFWTGPVDGRFDPGTAQESAFASSSLVGR